MVCATAWQPRQQVLRATPSSVTGKTPDSSGNPQWKHPADESAAEWLPEPDGAAVMRKLRSADVHPGAGVEVGMGNIENHGLLLAAERHGLMLGVDPATGIDPYQIRRTQGSRSF
jgi:hypothetical protein